MGVSWVFLTTFPAKRLVFQIEVDHIALDQEIGLISYSNGFGFMDFSWQWPFQCQKKHGFPAPQDDGTTEARKGLQSREVHGRW